LEFDSFNELKEALVGEWTIEHPMTPFFPHETYTFAIHDFPESIFSAPAPEVVSPSDGASVPPVFTLTWAWPPGVAHPNSRATLVEKFGPGDRATRSRSAHTPWNDLSAEIMAAHASGGLPERLELRAGSWHQEVLGGFVSEVTPQQEPSRFAYTIHADFFNYSAPIQVFVVVPEPSVATLWAIGAAVVAAAHRRRNKKVKLSAAESLGLK
jgi:hypothetical protein